jgi:hypothetical protein
MGFTAKTQGRTEAQLDAAESALGFALPPTYRSLMAQQNGGAVNYTEVAGLNQVSFDLLSEISSDEAPPVSPFSPLLTFREYILLTCDQEELDEVVTALAPFHPERLVLISPLDGHSGAYLDYGFRSETPTSSPGVLFIHDDGDDFLHFGVMSPSFADFDTFLSNLGQNSDFEDDKTVGIVSTCSYDELVSYLADALALTLTENVDDQYGNFNFDRWHEASVPIELDDETMNAYAIANGTTLDEMLEWSATEGRNRNVFCVLSPNQHRSGTFRYPNCPEVGLVMEVRSSWFPLERPLAHLVERIRSIPAVEDVVLLPSGTVAPSANVLR